MLTGQSVENNKYLLDAIENNQSRNDTGLAY